MGRFCNALLRWPRRPCEPSWAVAEATVCLLWSVSLIIGSALIRRRSSSITTTLPRSSASAICCSCLSSSLACSSGRRPEERRKRTTEGSAVSLNATIVPKSVSAETMVRPSLMAISKISSSVAACMPRSLTSRASCPAPTSTSATRGESALSMRNRKREMEPQTSGISRSLTAFAA